jgi:hypothetical protein
MGSACWVRRVGRLFGVIASGLLVLNVAQAWLKQTTKVKLREWPVCVTCSTSGSSLGPSDWKKQAAFRKAAEEQPRERVPLDWAMTQENLGLALTKLGERESGTVRLEQAVAAFDAALAVFIGALPGSDHSSECRTNRERALTLPDPERRVSD